ncbi:hypothetical protein HanIR_Chr03g0136451 [Helianthus annuus]|nr:hypothetical protein HanIR_Chr03g0136451 [Helianthus annuus]
MLTPISGRWRTYVSWPCSKLAFTSLFPKCPVPPMINTLLFVSISICRCGSSSVRN